MKDSQKLEFYKNCEGGNLPAVRQALESTSEGAMELLNWQNPNDRYGTVLHAAAYKGHAAVVELLLAKGANLNAPDSYQITALHYASSYGHIQIVEILISAGADLNAVDNATYKETALHRAADYGHAPVVEILISAGAEINAVNEYKNTALHLAAYKGHKAIAELLLRAGADATARNKYGRTPAEEARYYGKHDVANLIEEFLALPEIARPTFLALPEIARPTFLENHELKQKLVKMEKENLSLHTFLGTLHTFLGSDVGDPSSAYRAVAELKVAAKYKPNLPENPSEEDIKEAELKKEELVLQTLQQAGVLQEAFPEAHQTQAGDFVRIAEQHDSNISLLHVNFVRRNDFKNAGAILRYNICREKGWLQKGLYLTPKGKVLFVSHRWKSEADPDPTREQYSAILDFLDSADGRDVDLVWVDFSCICQDKESDSFQLHLKNLPTALRAATHFLVIPSLEDNATDLRNYLSRAWCRMETLGSIVSGVECFILYQVDEMKLFERIDGYEGDGKIGFKKVSQKVWEGLDENGSFSISRIKLSDFWVCQDPCEILHELRLILTDDDPKVTAVVQKALELSATESDIETAPFRIVNFWQNLGDCSNNDDKIPVLNLMIFIGYYSIKFNLWNET